jgi:hypothetical protein
LAPASFWSGIPFILGIDNYRILLQRQHHCPLTRPVQLHLGARQMVGQLACPPFAVQLAGNEQLSGQIIANPVARICLLPLDGALLLDRAFRCGIGLKPGRLYHKTTAVRDFQHIARACTADG